MAEAVAKRTYVRETFYIQLHIREDRVDPTEPLACRCLKDREKHEARMQKYVDRWERRTGNLAGPVQVSVWCDVTRPVSKLVVSWRAIVDPHPDDRETLRKALREVRRG